MDALLDRLHAAARNVVALQRLATVSRILLALAFIPTGLVKALGLPFTSLSTETPVGHFFDALHRTGAWWRFIGLGQITAGVLLLIPRTAALGALLFLPICANVFVITVSIDFAGTPVVTGLMLLASVFLVCWEYHRWRGLLAEDGVRRGAWREVPAGRLERAGYLVGGAGAMVALLGTRGLASRGPAMAGLVAGALGAVLVLSAWVRLAARAADRPPEDPSR